MKDSIIAKLIDLLAILVISIFPSNSNELEGQATSVSEGLFDSEEIFKIQLKGNTKELLKDRGDDHVYHPMVLSYNDNDGNVISHDLTVRTRGNFRRQRSNCKTPPLTLNFEEQPHGPLSLFTGQNKLKLVVPCQGEKHVIREYLVYKLYNHVSDYSFRVRLVLLEFFDNKKEEAKDPVYAFIIEDEDRLAARVGAKVLKRDRLKPEHMDKKEFHRMAVFATMVGNTDWSIQYRHNIKLLYPESSKTIVPVPYDFDLVGVVSASYAKPAPELDLRSVKVRRYRGYCLEEVAILNPVFQEFKGLKDEFYDVFSNCDLLEEKYVKSMHDYLDDFYEILDDQKKSEKLFLYPCDKYGTGNVVLTGMQKGK